MGIAGDDIWYLYDGTAASFRIRCLTTGVVGVNVSGAGSAAQIDEFDDYADAREIKNAVRAIVGKPYHDSPVLDKVLDIMPNGEKMLNLQPWFALGAGADWQNYLAIQENRYRIDSLDVRVEQTEQETRNHTLRIEELENENRRLKAQVAELQQAA